MTSTSAKANIEKYFTAYKDGDIDAMYSCLDPNYTFSDPAFPNLDPKHSRGMFAMFIKGRDRNKMKLTFDPVEGSDPSYTVQYHVDYIFNGNPVTNHIKANLTTTPEGLILRQVDEFNFYTWSSQSLGLVGKLFGWAPFMLSTVQGKAAGNLEKFLKSQDDAKL